MALCCIKACGAVYAAVGALVQAVGTRWIKRFMPPVVTGAVVAVIGLNLASIPVKNMAASNFDAWMQLVTFVSVALVAVLARGMLQRLLILIGLIASSLAYALLTNGLGLDKPIDLSSIAKADWFGMPGFSAPVFSTSAMLLIVPVVIILVAENLGHIKAVTAMTGKNLLVAAITLVLGTGDFTLKFGQFALAASAPRPLAPSCCMRCWTAGNRGNRIQGLAGPAECAAVRLMPVNRKPAGPARRPVRCAARSSAPGQARPGSRPAGAPGRRAPGFPLSAPD